MPTDFVTRFLLCEIENYKNNNTVVVWDITSMYSGRTRGIIKGADTPYRMSNTYWDERTDQRPQNNERHDPQPNRRADGGAQRNERRDIP